MSSALRLAKLTPPRLSKPLRRERLFAALDSARATPCVWIAAPPGAGKTTLAASYAAARRLPLCWYQLDAADSDPPTFFHLLRDAVAGSAALKKPDPELEVMTPELQGDVAAFARRFFRSLYARVKPRALVVFDNAQELSAGSPTLDALAVAIAEVPANLSMMILSRTPPGAALAHMQMSGRMSTFDASSLTMTRAEVQQLAAGSGPSHWDEAALAVVHERTGGWAAGVRLLLSRPPAELGTQFATPQETLFAYFATQVFQAAPVRWQDALIRLSFVGGFTVAAAEQLSGDEQVGRMLEHLASEQLFTYRKAVGGEQDHFEFHPLFRDFLRERAKAKPAQEIAMVQARSAQVMEQEGDLDATSKMLVALGDWQELTRWVRTYAAQLIAVGRWAAVVDAVEAMPASVVQDDAWLRHWWGAARVGLAPSEARQSFEAAYVVAERAGDRLCVLQTAAAVVQSYMLEYSHFQPLDRWIPVLESSLHDEVVFPTPDVELSVVAALTIALSYRDPGNATLSLCIERLRKLIHTASDINVRACAGGFLFLHGATSGSLALCDEWLPTLESLLQARSVSPLNRFVGLQAIAWYQVMSYKVTECLSTIDRIRYLVDAYALPFARRPVVSFPFWLCISRMDMEGARKQFRALEAVTNRARLLDRACLEGERCVLLQFDGDAKGAVTAGRAADAMCAEAGSFMHSVTYLCWLAMAYVAAKDTNEAAIACNRIEAMLDRQKGAWQAPWLEIVRALLAVQKGDDAEYTARLARSLEAGRQEGSHRAFMRLGPWMPRLCQLALDRDIEADYARWLICHFGWRPPDSANQRWPWAVRFQTFGSFGVTVNDIPLSFGRKAPRRLLLLLQVLIAFGGEDVPQQRLVDILWPDQDGDTAISTLDVTLRRVRDLLGHAGAVIVTDGRVSLNREMCWTDAWVFERGVGDAATEADRDNALKAYGGPFLGSEVDGRWVVQRRERYRRQYLELVARRGRQLEQRREFDLAADVYSKGLDADDLAESLYQGLIRCHLERGRRAEALSVYRRMRQVLSAVLGIEPSAASEALHLRAKGSP